MEDSKNYTHIKGWLVQDVIIKTTPKNHFYTTNFVKVQKNGSTKFIPIKAWNSLATFLKHNYQKNSIIEIVGEIEASSKVVSGSYRNYFFVLVHEFVMEKELEKTSETRTVDWEKFMNEFGDF